MTASPDANRFTRSFRAALNADEVEDYCSAGVRTAAEAGLLDERIGGVANDADLDSQVERAELSTVTLDEGTGEVAEELKRRSEVPGGGYPFKFDGKALRYIGSKTLAYEFCLAICRSVSLTEKLYARLPRNFERLSTAAARIYLGNGAKGIRLGWPTDDEDPPGHPKDFLGRAKLLADNAPAGSTEWEYGPTPDFDEVAGNAKDHGMDFVAWKPFPDERIGRITFVGQCACGRNDQEDPEKAKQLDLDLLETIFKRLTWLHPIRVFATPYHVGDPAKFKSFHKVRNVVLDRARIAAICEQEPDDADLKLLRPKFAELTKLVITRFKQQASKKRAKRR